MDREYALSAARRYAQHVTREFPGSRVILFGSCARDEASEHSDIDIAVLYKVSSPSENLSVSARLWRLTAVCDPLIEPVLISEFNNDRLFHREIQRDGIYIN